MNKFRIWLADLVTGGDYSDAKETADHWRNAYEECVSSRTKSRKLWVEAEHKLYRIAAQEKPTSNSTVRRMARIARGEE